MTDTTTLLTERRSDVVHQLLPAHVPAQVPTHGLSPCDQEAAVRLSKLAEAVLSLAAAAPFGAPALDDPHAVIRAALEMALLEYGDAF
jgi:hypothetical protein